MKTKPHTTRGAKGRKKRKGGKKGLSGASKVEAAKKKSGESGMVKPLGVIAGLAVASGVGYVLDKVPFLQPDEEAEGFQVKSVIKPAALLAAGGAGIFLTHNKTGNAMAFANGVAWGVAGGGLFSGAKAVLKMDVFKGLGEDPAVKTKELTAEYYKDKAEDMAKLLEKSQHEINLPPSEDEAIPTRGELEGGEAFASEMQFDENNIA